MKIVARVPVEVIKKILEVLILVLNKILEFIK